MKELKDYLYYEEFNPSIKVYLGDSNEVMRLLDQVDLTITDPPYGMNFRSNHRADKWNAIHGDNELPIDTIKFALAMANRAGYVFCRWDNLSQLPPPKSVIAWVKNNWSMGDLKHEHGRQWEACLFYPKVDHEFIERIPDVIHADRTGNDRHPTQKPVDLMKRLIMCNVGQVILDPFAGSGSTLIACKELKRTGIGIEIDENHCATIKKRLMNTQVPFL
jgi:site-specific DNA-methyltransferase (adenine-specific)